jgi:acetyl esterase/lipase
MKRALLFLLLFTSAMPSPARAEEPNSLQPFPQSSQRVRLYKDLVYVPNGHDRQKLDLYVPENRNGLMPLIVWIHGGGWMGGSKNNCPPLPWTRKGYVVASIDYRLSQDAKFPAQIEDCKAAVRWLRVHANEYGIDEERIVAWGGSAGGHLASLLGTAGEVPEWEKGVPSVSSRVQAVIDWYGRADLTRVATDPAWANSPSALLLGGCGKKFAELAKEASPILHVSNDDPPFLIMHGTMDTVVPFRQSQAFEGALEEAGVESHLVTLEGAGHGGQDFLSCEKVKRIDAFLEKHLAPRKTTDAQ